MTIRRTTACLAAIALTLPALAQRGDGRDRELMEGKPPADLEIPPAPVLSPEEAIRSFEVDERFRVEAVATEPMIQDPVCLTFDTRGRMWVAEMQSYMPNVDGKGEDAAVSRIMILEDLDGDGIMDTAKPFLENLVLPRALALVDGGLLYATPPALRWVRIGPGDKPVGEHVVVDPKYATGGNVEHQPNGLLRGIDNWYYNAKSNKRYRHIAGEWVREETENRGQWGIAQDNYGRLYHNGNSSNARADLTPPGALMRNPHFKAKGASVGVAGNAVFPIRVNPGVNRGYKRGTLGSDWRLARFTGASGPAVYRGGYYPEDFHFNSFVPEPCGNLIKRNVMREEGWNIKGGFAYEDREFLASRDERFRPVTLYNGLDGTLLIVDMYRGIIQHRTYVTTYLRRQILARGLDQPTGLGRIYRVVRKDRPPSAFRPMHEESADQLVARLASPHGPVRDLAQQALIEQDDPAAPALLREVLREGGELAQIHAVWTLEGLGELSAADVAALMESPHDKAVAQGIRAAESLAKKSGYGEVVKAMSAAAEREHPAVRLQLAFSLGPFNNRMALELLAEVLGDDPDDLMRRAAVSGLAGREAAFRPMVTDKKLVAMLDEAIKRAEGGGAAEAHNLVGAEAERYERGKVHYQVFCGGCHMPDGAGLAPLAPPLAGSEWVTGPPARPAAIALLGLEGPIEVAGKTYAPPDIPPLMPGLGLSPELTDERLAELLTYIRNSWGNRAAPVRTATVAAVRKRFADRVGVLSVDEAKEIR